MGASEPRVNTPKYEKPTPRTTPAASGQPDSPTLSAVPALPRPPEGAPPTPPGPPLPPDLHSPPPLAPLTRSPTGETTREPTSPPGSFTAIVQGLLEYLNSRDRIWASAYRPRRRLWWAGSIWLFGAGVGYGVSRGGIVGSLISLVT